jgi:proteasome accessory factor A
MASPHPITCGFDTELANFITGRPAAAGLGSGAEASLMLLNEFSHGHPRRPPTRCQCSSCTGVTPPAGVPPRPCSARDWGRRYLPENAACIYIDSDHIELASMELTSAFDYVAAWDAMLSQVTNAMHAANAKLPDGQQLKVGVNNSDGFDHSYGGHLNHTISDHLFRQIFDQQLQKLLLLCSFHASAMIFTGQGKVGTENGRDAVDFQITQRGDFVEQIVGEQTMFSRPLQNARRECLAALHAALARLHTICHDSTRCPVATLLKVGSLQIFLAMMQGGALDETLFLRDPVAAVHLWGHDPDLTQTAELVTGQRVTAAELQLRYIEAADRFVSRGGCDGLVPDAAEILVWWADTVDLLHQRAFAPLTRRLDWVLKRSIIDTAIEEHRLPPSGPEAKMLDHLYGSLGDGLYEACDAAGEVEQLVSPEAVQRLRAEPPNDTRAFTRAMLLRRWAPLSMDWHRMTFRLQDSRGYSCTRTLSLDMPADFGRDAVEWVFADNPSLDVALTRLGAPAPQYTVAPTFSLPTTTGNAPAPR